MSGVGQGKTNHFVIGTQPQCKDKNKRWQQRRAHGQKASCYSAPVIFSQVFWSLFLIELYIVPWFLNVDNYILKFRKYSARLRKYTLQPYLTQCQPACNFWPKPQLLKKCPAQSILSRFYLFPLTLLDGQINLSKAKVNCRACYFPHNIFHYWSKWALKP